MYMCGGNRYGKEKGFSSGNNTRDSKDFGGICSSEFKSKTSQGQGRHFSSKKLLDIVPKKKCC